jgi:hypothetical protein
MKRSRSIATAFIVAALTIAAASVLFPALGAGPSGTRYQFTVPKQGTMNASATYYCWLPEAVGTVRCIIVHHHGCGREGDGSLMMSDVQWLTLAKKWHAAFIGPSEPSNPDCSNWYTVTRGSANSYLMALDSLARRSGHPEIKTVPWAIWGHSGGALWMTGLANIYPERIAVGVAQSGSVEMSNTPGALKIPILHCNGKTDALYNTVQFVNGRAKDALWAHAVNPHPQTINNTPGDLPGQGHACHDVRMIAIPWIDYALTSRLPDKAGDSALKEMETTSAWLGDTLTFAIASAATFPGDKLKACWFPNQTFAAMWAEYMKNGTLKDSTPVPPAPYPLTGTYSSRQIVLNWDADADLETGIKTFIIYRNGALLQTIQYPNAPASFFTLEKGFQRWDYGDQPSPVTPPTMTFTDATVSDTGTYRYQVSTVNWADVAGPKSGTLTLSRGKVTGAAAHSARSPAVKQTRISLMYIGSRTLFTGPVAFYDVRGRRLAAADIPKGQRADLTGLLGNRSNTIVVARFQTK